MEFKNTLEILQSQVREIVAITDNFKKTDTIPFIEIDLLLEKLRNIYDLTTDLRSAVQADYSTKNKTSVNKDEKGVTKKESTEIELDIKPSKSSTEKINEKDDLTKTSDTEKSKSEGKLVSDRFQRSDPTLNDEISGKSKKEDITAQYKTKPIGSINSAIGLNEKFELINHLFNGNKDKFDRTMEVLDRAGSFVEAYNYLEGNFEWDMDDMYVQRILELIRRKLIVRRNEQ